MANERLTENERIALEKQEHKRLLARERYKRYYAKPENRKRTLEAQKARREADKRIFQNAISKIKTQVVVQPEPEPEPDFNADFDADLGENFVIDTSTHKSSSNKKVNYTQDEIIELLKNDNDFKSENTRKTYISSVKRIFTMTGCADMKS